MGPMQLSQNIGKSRDPIIRDRMHFPPFSMTERAARSIRTDSDVVTLGGALSNHSNSWHEICHLP